MLFNFPSNKEKVSVNLRISIETNNKIRKLAEKHKTMVSDIYITLIEESLKEYESLFGPIEERKEKPHYMEVKKKEQKEIQVEESDTDEVIVITAPGPARIPELSIDIEDQETKKAIKNGWTKYPRCTGCETIERRRFSGSLCYKCYFDRKDKDKDLGHNGKDKRPQYGEVKIDQTKFKYCNYLNCPNRGIAYPVYKMINDNEKYYCSEKCKEKNTLKLSY